MFVTDSANLLTILQRLFVYLTAITVWYLSMEIMHIRPYTDLDQFCAASGFLDQWAGVSVLIFTFTVSVFVLYKVCQEDIVRLCDCQISNMKKLLEASFVFFLIILPLPFIWIPFLHGNYARDGEPWCWIVTHNKDCSENVEGFWEQIGLWYAPLSILGLLIVLSVFTTAGIFCKRACTYRLTRRRHERKAAETIILLIFLLLFGTLAGIEATSNLYFSFTKKQQGYALSMAHALITPVGKLMIPVGYFFYLYSLKKFRLDSIKASASKWKQQFICHCRKSEQLTHPTVGETVTVRSSYAVIDLSDTSQSHIQVHLQMLAQQLF